MMRSTFGGLNIMVRGLFAQQASLDTVGHNIANANTDGFSRQRVNGTATRPEIIFGGANKMEIGSGVNVTSITRARDNFIDRQMWKETSTLGYSQSQENALSRIEGVFNDTSDTGLQSGLNNFWSAWQTLSTNASDYGTRIALRERAVELVDNIQHSTQQLKDIASDINSEIDIKVKRVNQISEEILGLNRLITATELGGTSNANDLRDRRDLLVDELSGLVKVQVNEDSSGNYLIQANGANLVDATSYTELETKNDPSSPLFTIYGQPVNQIYLKGNSQPVSFSGGELKGLLDSRDSDTSGIKAYLDKLNTISKFFLIDFNTIHKQGFGLDDGVTPKTGNNFFGDNTFAPPVSGNYIDALKVNPLFFLEPDGTDYIAAKSASDQGNGSGTHAVKLSQALKIPVTDPSIDIPLGTRIPPGTSVLGDGISLDNYYNSLVAALGVQSQKAKTFTENQQVLVNQITNWRESVAGVNMDEEMTNMIRFQKGYSAASRVITTMDEMLDKLINGTGVVGR